MTDEGLASPSGRGAGGGEGDFCPLSRLRRQLPQSGSQGGRIVTGGNPRRGPRQCALAPNDTQFFGLGGCGSPEYPAKLETFQRSAQNGMPWIVEKAENHFLRQKGLDFLRKLL